MAHIQGVEQLDCQHPFHCWSSRKYPTDEQFLSRNARLCKTGEKTLG